MRAFVLVGLLWWALVAIHALAYLGTSNYPRTRPPATPRDDVRVVVIAMLFVIFAACVLS